MAGQQGQPKYRFVWPWASGKPDPWLIMCCRPVSSGALKELNNVMLENDPMKVFSAPGNFVTTVWQISCQIDRKYLGCRKLYFICENPS